MYIFSDTCYELHDLKETERNEAVEKEKQQMEELKESETSKRLAISKAVDKRKRESEIRDKLNYQTQTTIANMATSTRDTSKELIIVLKSVSGTKQFHLIT